VSLDALDQPTFARMSGGRGTVDSVLEGIAAASAAGFDAVKVNCVVVRGMNEHALVPLAERFRGTGVVVRFIEFMDVGTLNRWRPEAVLHADEMIARINAHFPLTRVAPHYPGEVAQRYAYADGQGEIGMIASVSRPFCGGCSRLRMSAEGTLYTCLFAKSGHDLRGLLRAGADEEAIRARVAGVWRARSDRYSEERARGPVARRVEMYQLGG
jgi:cyclic pyranopterin phosphate synthase